MTIETQIQKGVYQKDFAEQIGVHPKLVSNIINNEKGTKKNDADKWHVVSGGTILLTNKSTGFSCTMEWLNFCTFDSDGRIIMLTTFVDSDAFLRAMRGI